MDLIESSLCRLHENVSRLVGPSAALWDVTALKAQIELRQRALTDIEIISCRLRPFMRRGNQRRYRKSRERGGRRSRLGSANGGS
jgi:hypothetical protein